MVLKQNWSLSLSVSRSSIVVRSAFSVPGTNPMADRDAHIACYGEIVGACIAE